MNQQPPLRGVRVLELGSYVAAPSAARLLADLGAEVIKIEPPGGDEMRAWGAPAPDGTSWWFKAHNRNKRLIALDLRDERDRDVVRELAKKSDVVLENFRPGRMTEWGLDAAALRALNPRLIYASISGYGSDGPYAERAGFGSIAESMGGLRFVTGFPDRPPVRVGMSLADELAALYLVIGIVGSLFARERDGAGETVEVSLLESIVSWAQGALPEYVATGKVRERTGNRTPSAAPSDVYPTKDGKWLAIGANADSIFKRFMRLLGRDDLANDPRFADNRGRSAHIDELDAVISAWTRSLDANDASDRLAAAGVPAGPVNSIADIVADPQIRARNFVVELADPEGTRVSAPGLIPRFTDRGGVLSHAAGAVGSETEAVLRELGIARERVASG